MQRFALKWIAIAALACGMASGLTACANDGVGDPCIPESIPCAKGECGFGPSESYVESSSVQCRSRVCIVHKLIGGPNTADPRDLVDRNEGINWDTVKDDSPQDGPSAVTTAQLDQSVYCTCRCKDGDGKKVEGCECPSGFSCDKILTLGGEGIRGFYCVRPVKTP